MDTWAGEKRYYESQFYAVLHRRTHIIEIKPPEDELGYTSESGEIHLARVHQVMESLSDEMKTVFRCGVFTHETLHQVFTAFAYLQEVLGRHTDSMEKRIIALYANLVEDPAIEYFASTVFGGEMLQALRFSIRHIYSTAPNLEESKSAFAQFINALIMFGDVGLLKGHFTFDEAEKYFRQIAPDFDRTVTNPDAKKRIDVAEKWMILTRPLWKQDAGDDESLSDMLQSLMDDGMMSSPMTGDSDGQEQPSGKGGKNDENAKRRAAFAEALDEEQQEDGEGKGAGDGDADDDESKGEQSESSGDQDSSEDADSNASQSSDGGQHKSALAQFTDDGDFGPTVDTDADFVAEILDRVEEMAKKEAKESEEDTMDMPVPIPKAHGGKMQSFRCENVRIMANESAENSYRDIMKVVGHDVQLLTSSLRNIFRNDMDEYMRMTSGRYNIKRDLAHTSVKIFDKKREKKNIDDMAVMLLVDNSGSMTGKKIKLARDAAVMLAEVFSALSIPCYIMGFTADCNDATVVHRHYVSWKNTRAERLALTDVQALANNDDGYSIRYATQLLAKKRAEHKILFVLSDGAPACNRYRYTNGIVDTAQAIRDAKRVCTVFGIGIGIQAYQELKDMYKGAYINVTNTSELSTTLAKQLKIIIKRF